MERPSLGLIKQGAIVIIIMTIIIIRWILNEREIRSRYHKETNVYVCVLRIAGNSVLKTRRDDGDNERHENSIHEEPVSRCNVKVCSVCK